VIAPSAPRRVRRGTLYAAAGALAVVVVVTLVFTALNRAAPARAQVDVSVDPAMTKGTASAPVTIFEFSDYQ
jgi:hypothetical protein